MHIEFDLPNHDTVLNIAIHKLNHELDDWSKQYDVTIIRYEYIKGYPRYQVLLPTEQAYTLFALTWGTKEAYFKHYTIVD